MPEINTRGAVTGQDQLLGLLRRTPHLLSLQFRFKVDAAGTAVLAAALPRLTALTRVYFCSGGSPDCALAIAALGCKSSACITTSPLRRG